MDDNYPKMIRVSAEIYRRKLIKEGADVDSIVRFEMNGLLATLALPPSRWRLANNMWENTYNEEYLFRQLGRFEQLCDQNPLVYQNREEMWLDTCKIFYKIKSRADLQPPCVQLETMIAIIHMLTNDRTRVLENPSSRWRRYSLFSSCLRDDTQLETEYGVYKKF